MQDKVYLLDESVFQKMRQTNTNLNLMEECSIRSSVLPSSGYVLYRRISWYYVVGACRGKPSSLLWRAGGGPHISEMAEMVLQ